MADARFVHVYDLTVADALARRLVDRETPHVLVIPVEVFPLFVLLDAEVTSDDAIITGRPSVVAVPGTYTAKIAAGGAVSIFKGGVWLGVKPGEFNLVCPYAAGPTHLGIYDRGRRSFTVTAETPSELWIREAWTSWRNTCDGGDNGDDHECAPHCDQTYVAYRATPRIGYRPIPDRQRITYLDDASPLEQDTRLQGPWNPPDAMPREFSRVVLAVSSAMLVKVTDVSATEMRGYGARCNLDTDHAHCTAMPCLSLRQNFTKLLADEWDWDIEASRQAAPRRGMSGAEWMWVVTVSQVPRAGAGAG